MLLLPYFSLINLMYQGISSHLRAKYSIFKLFKFEKNSPIIKGKEDDTHV
ncbi:hypothetical protein HMPREF0548_1587 [Lactobacillus ultunensis DSM 16047]|uniref:Uncharacterized protein n=1 Tax=Lactobacillus ultunensis DSM 16047 TaxID=525365 RepID=C2EPJ1_9LACO|nr:hypothetical protein HMPREF0548_1587 [Lactobacillus ultunensis DSM 16047]